MTTWILVSSCGPYEAFCSCVRPCPATGLWTRKTRTFYVRKISVNESEILDLKSPSDRCSWMWVGSWRWNNTNQNVLDRNSGIPCFLPHTGIVLCPGCSQVGRTADSCSEPSVLSTNGHSEKRHLWHEWPPQLHVRLGSL